MKKRYKILFFGLAGVAALTSVGLVTLIVPGWNLGPVLGWVEGRIARQLPGMDLALGGAHVQWKGGREGVFTLWEVVVAEAGGEKNLQIGTAQLQWSVGRLVQGRVLPARVAVEGFRVWVSSDENGQPRPPRWLPQPAKTESEAPADWGALRLGSIPLIWKLEEGEEMHLELVDYVASLRQGEARADFVLPLLTVTLRGWERGVKADWEAGEASGGTPPWAQGGLIADVLAEQIEWHNELFLPLTPDLADWLEAGFPYLPVPSFLETQATFQSEGTVDLRAAETAATGRLTLAAGSIALPGQPELRLGIPAVTMDFASDLSYGPALPRLRSDLKITIGEGARAAEIGLIAEVDGAADRIRLETTGALRYLEDLLQLLPEAWQPVAVTGDFSWEASMDTRYTAPTKVRIGKVALTSEGISVLFTGEGAPTIEIESFAFAGRVEKAGQAIAVDPFHLTVGPVRVEGSGLHWDGDQPEEGGRGQIALAPLALADVLQQIPPSLLDLSPEVVRWLNDTRIEKLALDFAFQPDAADGLEGFRLDLKPEWECVIAGMPLSGAGEMMGFPFRRQAEAKITLARFNPGNLRVPEVEAFGRWDGDFEISVAGNFDARERVARVRGELQASPGVFSPGEGLDAFLARPVGIEGARVEGHLSLDRAFSGEARFQLASSLGSLEGSLRPETFLLGEALPETISVETALAVRPAATAFILPQLRESLVASLGLSSEEWADFDLERLAVQLRVPLSPETGLAPPSAWSGNGDLALRTGRERVGVELSMAPAEAESLHLDWKTTRWNPGRADLRLAHRFGVGADDFSFPLTVSGSVDLSFASASPVSFAPEAIFAAVALEGHPGFVKLPDLLERLLEWSHLEGRIGLDVLKMRLSEASFRARTELGTVSFESDGLSLAPVLSGRAALAVEGVDLGRVVDSVAAAVFAQAGLRRDDLRLVGILQTLQIHLELGETPANFPLPFLVAAEGSLAVADLHVSDLTLPALEFPRIEFEGRLDHRLDQGVRQERLALKGDLDGFLFPEFRLSLQSHFTENFEGPFGGTQRARLRFHGMEGSDLSLTASVRPDREWDLKVRSDLLNLGPLFLLAESKVAAWFAGDSAPGVEELPPAPEKRADSLPSPSPRSPQEASPPLLPTIHFSLDLDRILIGSVRDFGPLRLSVRLVDDWPSSVSFSLEDGDQAIRLEMQPDGDGWGMTFSLGKLHHWIGVAVSPLSLYQSPFFRTDASVAQLRDLPASFDQGDFNFTGALALRPELHASLDDISLAGLILQTEVTFLSRIAALVDRRVMLLVPFKEFRVASLTYDAAGLLEAQNIFVDGPINLELSLARFDSQTRDTLIQGKVFGIAFEVIGVAPDLSFYLQERSPAIRALTVQDDFDW